MRVWTLEPVSSAGAVSLRSIPFNQANRSRWGVHGGVLMQPAQSIGCRACYVSLTQDTKAPKGRACCRGLVWSGRWPEQSLAWGKWGKCLLFCELLCLQTCAPSWRVCLYEYSRVFARRPMLPTRCESDVEPRSNSALASGSTAANFISSSSLAVLMLLHARRAIECRGRTTAQQESS